MRTGGRAQRKISRQKVEKGTKPDRPRRAHAMNRRARRIRARVRSPRGWPNGRTGPAGYTYASASRHPVPEQQAKYWAIDEHGPIVRSRLSRPFRL